MLSPLEEANTGSDPISGQPAIDKPKKNKKKKVSKGVETLFRTTLASHLRLSQMADTKANLMISVNTLIIPIIISAYVRSFEGSAKLLVPTLILLVVSLTTIVVALLATNPTIRSGAREPVGADASNMDLLFFGDYTTLTAEEYRSRVQHLISDDELLYNSLIDNIYAQGRVLSRKYRLLKFAYRFFMVGFSIAVISYAFVLFLFK